jgi:hypothetical protein
VWYKTSMDGLKEKEGKGKVVNWQNERGELIAALFISEWAGMKLRVKEGVLPNLIEDMEEENKGTLYPNSKVESEDENDQGFLIFDMRRHNHNWNNVPHDFVTTMNIWFKSAGVKAKQIGSSY